MSCYKVAIHLDGVCLFTFTEWQPPEDAIRALVVRASCAKVRVLVSTHMLKNSVRKPIRSLQATAIDKCACICYPCAKQLKRNINNPTYKPRWCNKPSIQQPQCSIKNCRNTLCKRTKLASVQDVERILQQPVSLSQWKSL